MIGRGVEGKRAARNSHRAKLSRPGFPRDFSRGADSTVLVSPRDRGSVAEDDPIREWASSADSGEEFDRMLAAVPKVRPRDAAAWIHYLRGPPKSG